MQPDNPEPHQGQPGIATAALSGLCPRCGAKTLFAGPVRFAHKCNKCGLDFDRFNVGDGPAAILILLIGGLVAGLAIWLQLAIEPPYWVQALIWVPVSLALVIVGLRISKAALLASEFRNRSGEGRLRK